ncbi:sister chromatid cohesion 1 protein 3-like [Typha angustifolia]|uniref:sister chromatid cohesion 1 protein 3-like n=1 Tax=Typha angustifolia TaxID=59011 RepID=UPI003C2C610D
MFYSHTFLAKKSPLGTVWIAAHLERKIKKPQIEVIDIPSYAESIMFPEVPLALRLSGHLLLGLVRIYSWKVNYLFQDCNRMLTDIRTAFAAVQIDLPIEADRAPFEFVTLPDTFELDALELDDAVNQIDGLDNHCKSYDQITMTDEISGGGDQYIAFLINEDSRSGSFSQRGNSSPGVGSINEDVLPPFEAGLEAIATPILSTKGLREPGLSNPAEDSSSFNQTHFSQEVPEIEVMREAVQSFEPRNLLGWDDANMETDVLHEGSFPSTKRKDSLSPIMEGVSVSGDIHLAMPSRANAPSVASADDLDILNTGISLGHQVPDLELQPSPLVKEKKTKKRKKKQFFDESLVLTNGEMKKQLEDTSKLLSKRRKLPCSALGAWKFCRTLQNEVILHEPLLSGMCNNIKETFKKSIPLSIVDSSHLEASPGLAHVSSQGAMPDLDMEPELPRFDTHVEANQPDIVPSPSGRGELTPFRTSDVNLNSGMGKTFDTEVLSTFESLESAGRVGPEPEVSLFPLEEEQPFLYRDSPEIPGLLNSADGEDLNFLEASNTSFGSEALEVGNLSARTRAVAQYLKEHSPSTPSSKDQSGTISLNRILEGKTRKQCARMFFETLVLKSYGLVDVQQEEDYGDILISTKPALSTVKF